MKRLLLAAFALVCASLPQLWAATVLTTPMWYQLVYMSPNGKWACGVYSDYSSTNHAFRWNLETGEIEVLDSDESEAWGVSDNGVVCGSFKDDQVLSNGASVAMAGYWKDGSWHHIETPEGASGGFSYGSISPDGRYMSGTVIINGDYLPYLWEDGKILRALECPHDGVPFGISPDGQSVVGWAYPDHNGKEGNRAPAYWDKDGKLNFISDYESPWSVAKRFSPDGKKIIYWGGYNDSDDQDVNGLMLAAIYDIESGETTYVPESPSSNGGFDVYGISNSGTVACGYEFNAGYGAFVYRDGESVEIEDYLAERGVNIEDLGVLYDKNKWQTMWTAAISPDDSRLAMVYYAPDGQYHSMVIIFDEKGAVAPVDVAAEQMQGINAVCLTWGENVLADNVQGYNIYRGATKLNSEPLTATRYYDNVEATGTYTYTVEAVYASQTVKAEEVSVTVEAQAVSAPQAVSVRQRGVNSGVMQWMAPASNYINRTYVDMNSADIEGFGANTDEAVSFELAIKFDKEDLANYAGYKVTKVQFYPMDETATDWTLNLYKRDIDSTLTLLDTQAITQELTYNTINTVTLDTPLDLPDDELIVAIGVTSASSTVMGMDYGKTNAGYSDLLRLATEKNFYSMYEVSLEGNTPYVNQWLINMVLAPSDADDSADKVDHYTIYDNGTKVGETTDLAYTIEGLTEGDHTLGVAATFANGTSSEPASADLAVTTNLKGIDNVYLTLVGKTGFNATWEAPLDDDDTFLTYASGEPAKSAPVGTSDNAYGFLASAVYTRQMLQTYDGYRVYALRFYPLADALFTFYIEKNDEEVCTVDATDYVLNHWNTVYLPEPLTIDGNAEYRLILDIYDAEAGKAPLAIDNNVPINLYSDAISQNGGTSWSYMEYDASVSGNWMIGWRMAAADGKPLDVDGYDVFVDGTKKNTETLTDTKYAYDFGATDEDTHSIRVDVRYPSVAESVEGTETYFNIEVGTGIEENTVEKLSLRIGDNYLRVEGDGVTAVSLYGINGTEAATAAGNTLNITNLASGVYVVKAKAAEGELVRKIEICR